MAKKGVNMSELSDVTGLSRSTISNIYNQKSKRIDFETINKLCIYFNCEANDLLVIEGIDIHTVN